MPYQPFQDMECRPGCAACCIAISILFPIPGHPRGKAAGLRCGQLTGDNRCALFGSSERPAVCGNLTPCREMCGFTDAEAFTYLANLEKQTAPAPSPN
jgi:hypothetical protein